MSTRRSTVDVINDCPLCSIYLAEQPHLIAACASVGIEHGKSTDEMLVNYMALYHQKGHRE